MVRDQDVYSVGTPRVGGTCSSFMVSGHPKYLQQG